jgi:hypothetical protein
MTDVPVYLDGHTHHIRPGLTLGQHLNAALKLAPGHYLDLEDSNRQNRVPINHKDWLVIHEHDRFVLRHDPYPIDDNPRLQHGIRPHYNNHKIPEDKTFFHAKVTFEQLSKLDKHFAVGDGISVVVQGLPDEKLSPTGRFIVQDRDYLVTTPAGNVGLQGPILERHVGELRSLYGAVDVHPEANRTLIVLKDIPLPNFWSRNKTDVLVQVQQGYPVTAMDMFWVPGTMTLSGGRAPSQAAHHEAFLGLQWQRFSWHYVQPWDPTRHNLVTHVQFCLSRFIKNI